MTRRTVLVGLLVLLTGCGVSAEPAPVPLRPLVSPSTSPVPAASTAPS